MKTLLKTRVLIVILFFISSASVFSQEIFDAVRTGNNGKVSELLSKDPSLVKAKTTTGETLLHIAAANSNVEISSLLIAKGADPEAKDASNNTTLTNAIRSKSLEIVKVVVEGGANVNNRGLWNFLPIQVAAEFASNDIVNYLIDKGADIPVEQGQDAYQLLSAACSKGLTKLFEKMIEKGFVLQSNQYTRTLLHLAAAGGSDKIIEALLFKGFKVMSGDGYGWSPLHSAAEKGNLKVVELLVAKGADINDRNSSGRTPYNLADYFGHKEVCDFLISKGADKSDQKFPVLTGKYLGQKEPDTIRKIFAVDIVTTKYMIHGNITFTPDGDEAYWSGTYPSEKSMEEKWQIQSAELVNGQWSKPQLASFSKIGYDDDSPFVTPDGKKLFFLSRRPLEAGGVNTTKENIWYITREGSGWSQPKPLDIVNSLDMHWQISVDKKGSLYFGARDPEDVKFGEIFCSKFVNGEYQKPEQLSERVNSENREGSPFISPDGDYLLFDRASKFGQQMGLFISFLNKDGSWTEAKPIAEIAKISPFSQCCNVSGDGKFLFYIAGYTNEFGVYWTNASFINKMKADSGDK
jgi:ankyrin repeat protein